MVLTVGRPGLIRVLNRGTASPLILKRAIGSSCLEFIIPPSVDGRPMCHAITYRHSSTESLEG